MTNNREATLQDGGRRRRCALGSVGDEWGVATMPFFTYDAKMKTVCMCALGSVGDEWEVGIHAVGVS